MAQRGSNKKVSHSLVAMSSAAVLAVYAAGYTRTRSAAQRLEDQSVERRPAVAGPPRTAPVLTEAPDPAPIVPAVPVRESTAEPAAPAAASPAKLPSASGAASSAPAPAVPVDVPPAEPVAAPVEMPAEKPFEAPAPAEIVPAIPVPATPVPAPPAPAAAMYKDGTYLGWGTSRHGDIQAQVVIEGGRIASATIAQCRTRYSCNVIAHLPPQVAQRQSPEVDVVSGATQSANAFYYGVVDALSKAK
jgi:uncharacterized protein with FMN-binding domain